MHRKRIFIIIAVCLLSMVILAGACYGGWWAYRCWQNQYTMQISLQGEAELSVEYGDTYTDPGAKAQFYGTHLHTEPTNVAVAVSQQVDTGKIGEYLVKYTAEYHGVVGTAYRTVRVADTKAPEIILTADPANITPPGKTYQEEGYKALDNHDGDITDRVIRRVSRDKIIYTVTDSFGNKATVERIIFYNDAMPPALMLNGSKYITLRTGQAYEEPGYLASDDCDGNLTQKVQQAGEVDTEIPGVYTITYSVADNSGNKATASRKITVIEADNTEGSGVIIPDGKVIYLTFDDGPGPYTAKLLDILKKHHVQATFFVTNKPKYNHLMKRMKREGHSIAIHTVTHKYKTIYASEDAYFDDLYKMQAIIQEETGHMTTLVRFPGGSSNTVSRKYCSGIMTQLTQSVVERGFQYFDWNVDSDDAGGTKTTEQVFLNVVRGVQNKQYAVVLQHDIKSYSVDAVEKIIVWGLENGYAFLPLTSTSPGCHHRINN